MEFIKEPNRIYATNEEGAVVAQITFSEMEGDVCAIDHTEVGGSLRG